MVSEASSERSLIRFSISMSLGSSSESQAERDAVNYAYNEKSVVLVAAAGNSGKMEISYPAA